MNLLQLPDIAAMLILMGVLGWLRTKHRDARVDLWMLGLTFILIEAVALAVLRGSPAFARVAHALALDSYVLAAVTFGWAAREDILPGFSHLPLFAPPAVPLFALTTLYGFNGTARPVYVDLCCAALVLGIAYVLFYLHAGPRFRICLLAVHLAVWGPMTWLASFGQLRTLVYWGLACLYLLVALSFRKRVHRGGVGGIVIVAGFLIWALCFLAHPFVRSNSFYNALVDQLWTMQKFCVVIGMLLVLLEEQTRRLADEALHDVLTGLPNRRLFDDRLVQALSRAGRNGRSAAVFAVDLNHFKEINDTLGHRTGDRVLVQAAEMLKAKIRSSDTLARCGGDEFSIIVNDLMRPEDCERIAETLRAAIASVHLPAGAAFALSGSIGYAIFPDDVGDADELRELADIRMYKDKRRRSATLIAQDGPLPHERNIERRGAA